MPGTKFNPNSLASIQFEEPYFGTVYKEFTANNVSNYKQDLYKDVFYADTYNANLQVIYKNNDVRIDVAHYHIPCGFASVSDCEDHHGKDTHQVMNYASLRKDEVEEYGFPTKGEHYLVESISDVGEVKLTDDIYICLNGFNLTGITFTGDYSVYITNCVGYGGDSGPEENKEYAAVNLTPVADRELFSNKASYVYGHKRSMTMEDSENHNIVITTNKVNVNTALTLETVTVKGVENEKQANIVSGNNVNLLDVTFENMNAEGEQVILLDSATATISNVKYKNVNADYFMLTKNDTKLTLNDNKFNNAVVEKSVLMLGDGTKTTLSGDNEFIGNTLGTKENSISEAVVNVSLDNNSSFALTKGATLTIKDNTIVKTDLDQAMIKFKSSELDMPVTIHGDLIIEDNKYINTYESEHIISGFMANGTTKIGAGKVVINNNKVYDDKGVTESTSDYVHILYADIYV